MSTEDLGNALDEAFGERPKVAERAGVWDFVTEERKLELTELWEKAGVNRVKFENPNAIEMAVRHVLDKAGVYYIPEFLLSDMHVDIYVPECRLVIECDGDYWHTRPGVRIADSKRDAVHKSSNRRVVRLWEVDIVKDAEKALKKQLTDQCIELRGVTTCATTSNARSTLT